MKDPDEPKPGTNVIEQAVEGLADVAGYLKHDPVPPLWRELRNYDLKRLRRDAMAGGVVAIITIPQVIAYALIMGLPVSAALASAIIGSFFCALLSASHHHVFGPTNTSAIILAGTLATVATVPLEPLQKALVFGFLIGVIQLAAAFFKLGSLSRFISRTVTIAYSTAAAILIATSQAGHFVGIGKGQDVSLPETARFLLRKVVGLEVINPTLVVGLTALVLMMIIRRVKPRWPEGLIVLGLSGLVAVAADLGSYGVKLVRDTGELASAMPIFVGFPLNAEGLMLVPALGSAALAAAILGMLEGVTITKSIATRSGQKTDVNREIWGMGLGNLMSAGFGAPPGSASFVRSASAFEAGGKTQVAVMFGAGLVLCFVLFVSGVVNYVPVAALSAYVIMIAIRIINPQQIRIACRSTGSDAMVFWCTLSAALFLRLDTAIYIGIGTSIMLFLRKASLPTLMEYGFNEAGQLAQLRQGDQRQHGAISIIHVEGELFFGAADFFQEQVRYLAAENDIRVFILRMKNARHLDATSVMSLMQLGDFLKKSGRHLLVSGINPDVERVLRNSGAHQSIGAENIFPAEANLTLATKRALQRAKALLAATGEQKPEVRIFYDRPQGGGAGV